MVRLQPGWPSFWLVTCCGRSHVDPLMVMVMMMTMMLPYRPAVHPGIACVDCANKLPLSGASGRCSWQPAFVEENLGINPLLWLRIRGGCLFLGVLTTRTASGPFSSPGLPVHMYNKQVALF